MYRKATAPNLDIGTCLTALGYLRRWVCGRGNSENLSEDHPALGCAYISLGPSIMYVRSELVLLAPPTYPLSVQGK